MGVIRWLAVTRDGRIDVFNALRRGVTAVGVNGDVSVRRERRVTFCFSAAEEALWSGSGSGVD